MLACSTNMIIQTPEENRPAKIDWSVALPTGVTIDSSEFIQDSTDYTISNTAFEEQSVSFSLSGGTAGKVYNITNQIVTSDGEIVQTTIPFNCVEFNYVGTTCPTSSC